MGNKTDRLYFKVGTNVVSVPKEDLANQIIDCDKVEVLMWTKEKPFYKFEHNDLAQHIAETENIADFDGFDVPDSLIDQEIVGVLKKQWEKKQQEQVMISAAQLGAIHAQTMRNIRALAGARARLKRRTRAPYLGYVKHGQIEASSRVNKKTDKAVIGKIEVAK